jgi:predicted PurR-regulated permease PerM
VVVILSFPRDACEVLDAIARALRAYRCWQPLARGLMARLAAGVVRWSALTSSPERDRIAALGFYALAVLLAYLVYQLFRPFLTPLAWAGVLAICFYPTHQRFEQQMGRSLGAFASTAFVALLVIVPMIAAAFAFVSETARLLNEVPQLMTEAPAFAQRLLGAGLSYLPSGNTIDVAALVTESARRVAEYLSERLAAAFQNVVVFLADFVIMIFALFFLFRDAPTLMAAIRRILPLRSEIRERLILQTQALVTASVLASLIVAAVQGLLGGLAFWALGLRAPVFWGVLMAFFCLLPFGAWVVWGPAAIWLLLTGRVVRGLILLGLGAGLVSAVDNILRPLLLSERSEINGLLLLIGLLGGVIAFGSVGLVLGPVLMATAVGLFKAFTFDGEVPRPDPSA